MSSGLTTILLLVLAAGAGAGFVFWLHHRTTAEREAFQALAARRGWSLTISEQKLGRPASLRLTARSGSGWQAEARRLTHDVSGAPITLTTEFTAEEPHWSDGMLLIGPPIPPDKADLARSVLETPGSSAALSLLSQLFGEDPTIDMSTLRLYPGPVEFTVLATADPAHRVDLGDLAQAVSDWTPLQPGDKGQPVVILGPDGLRVRLRHGTRRADQMESLIDFSLGIARIL